MGLLYIFFLCCNVQWCIILGLSTSFCLNVAGFVGLLPVLAACHISSLCLLVKSHWQMKIHWLIAVCLYSRGSVVVHSRVEVLLELLEAAMRDEGGLISSKSALRYLMALISREFSRQVDRRGGTSTSESCTAVKSLRIVDPSMPSTGLDSHCVLASTNCHDRNSTGFSHISWTHQFLLCFLYFSFIFDFVQCTKPAANSFRMLVSYWPRANRRGISC